MTHMTALSLIILFLIGAVSLKDGAVSAFTVTVPNEVIAVKGGNATFSISYTLGSAETFAKFVFKKGSVYVFEAPYYVPPDPPVNDGKFSRFYASRGSTDFSFGKTEFNITLSQVTPNDEGQYTAVVDIVGDSKSAISQLVVDFLPTKPSIFGIPTQPVIGGAGPTSLTCTANLGKPEASMVWSRRIGNSVPYTNITDRVIQFLHIRIATVFLDTGDDGVQFRCQVSNRQATLSAETAAIKVTAPLPVSDATIQVCKTSTTQCSSPIDYSIHDQVSLSCGVNPSSPPIPAPHEYKWYQASGSSNGAVLPIKAVTIYVCNASNIVRGVTYTVSKQVTIRATAKPSCQTPVVDTAGVTVPTDTSSVGTTAETKVSSLHEGLTGGAIAGIVISMCAVSVLLLVIFLVILKRRGVSLPGSGGKRVSRASTKRQGQMSSQQTGNVSMKANVNTCISDTVETELTSTGLRKPDDDVATLLESLGLQVHAPAIEREQRTTNSPGKLTIEDLTSRLEGVPLGPSGIVLTRIGTMGPHEEVDGHQSQDGAYSDIQSPAYQQIENVAYVNVAQIPVYEGLANRAGGTHGEYATLYGASVGDIKASEYEVMTSPSQRR